MKDNNPYINFQNYILRTPVFSLSSYIKLTSNSIVSDEDFKQHCNNLVFKEALFLASPSMYEALEKWLVENKSDSIKNKKFKYSLLKYISRMSSRCTPFGLFAGCSVGEFGEETNIELNQLSDYRRLTRLDMNYLVALSKDLVKIKNIRNQILFFPNSSIYKAGSQLRYVEYNYINSSRQHQITAVNFNEYLDKVLIRATSGVSLEELTESIVDDEISFNEAYEFIETLVESQLLISELEPSVSGPDFFNQIKETLEKLKGVEDILTILKSTEESLKSIDRVIGNHPRKYLNICENLEQLNTKFEMKYMFQTDLVVSTKSNILNKDHIKKIKKGLSLLNKITLPPKATLLTEFIDAFYERFDESTIPLSNALDVEIGIGYKQDLSSGDNNPLIDNIRLSGKPPKIFRRKVEWNSINSILQKKIIKGVKNNNYSIKLSTEDFKDYEDNWHDLPDTISVLIETLQIQGEKKIKFIGCGGPSAAKLFGRFCYADEKLFASVKDIISKETSISKQKLLAEIVHLPESRVGNILMKPDFREYEIPYLAKSIKALENQLPLDDLTISLDDQKKISLKSIKHGKEVIPRLTSAHNFSQNSLPIYHFLADLQNQGIREGINFHLGPFEDEYEFIPRIEFDNIILFSATWNLTKESISELLENETDDENLSIMLKKFVIDLKLPQYALLINMDKELLINFKNLSSVRMFLDEVHNRLNFKLTEFLFEENEIVKKDHEHFTNQIFVSFYNQVKLNTNE